MAEALQIYEVKNAEGAVVHTVWLPPGSYTVAPKPEPQAGGQ